jgi:hypothetical protein
MVRATAPITVIRTDDRSASLGAMQALELVARQVVELAWMRLNSNCEVVQVQIR